MKDSELKAVLQSVYSAKPSNSQKEFIRKHKKRELCISELLYMQIKYMKWQYAIIIVLMSLIISYAFYCKDALQISVLSAGMPFLAVIALLGLGQSERVGMGELEMTTRFSTRMLKVIRLVLAGIVGTICMMVVYLVLRFLHGFSMPEAMLITGLPYLTATYLSMIVIRKWHAKENIYGCIAIAVGVGVTTITLGEHLMQTILLFGKIGCACALLIVTTILINEIIKYMKENEELQWNLC